MNYYIAVLGDGEQVLQGIVRAKSGDAARDLAYEQASQLIDFQRFPHIKWDLVASERPFPKGLRIEEMEGREFLFIPMELAESSTLYLG
jgi:hypothetical protein